MVKTIKGFSKAVWIMAIICRVLVAIGFVFMLITMSVLLYLPSNSIVWEAAADGKVTVNADSFNLGGGFAAMLERELGGKNVTYTGGQSIKGTITDAALMLIPVLIQMILAYLVLLFLGNLFKKISNSDKPFSCGMDKSFITLGIFVIIYFIVPEFIYGLILAVVGSAQGIDINFNVGLNLNKLTYIFAFVVFALLLKYGAALENGTTNAPFKPQKNKEKKASFDTEENIVPALDEKIPSNPQPIIVEPDDPANEATTETAVHFKTE